MKGTVQPDLGKKKTASQLTCRFVINISRRYYLLRLANPISARPNNANEVGSGTAVITRI